MELWEAFTAAVRSWFEQLPGSLQILSTDRIDLLLVALIVPVAVALLSRQAMTVVTTLFLALLAALVLTAPLHFNALAVIGVYLGSFLVAIWGWRTSRGERLLKSEIVVLRNDVNRLLEAESRRFLVELKSGKSASADVAKQAD